jgi:hypothetical protein
MGVGWKIKNLQGLIALDAAGFGDLGSIHCGINRMRRGDGGADEKMGREFLKFRVFV